MFFTFSFWLCNASLVTWSVQLIVLWSFYDILSCRPFLQPFKHSRDGCRQCWPVQIPRLRRRRQVLAFYHLYPVLPVAASDALHSQCYCSVHMGTSDLTHSAITGISFGHNLLKMMCHYVCFVFGEGIHNVGSEEGVNKRLAVTLPASPPHKGHAAAQWLTHCATNRKVAGLIPDGVTGIFHWHNPSGRPMAMGCKGGLCVGLETLPPSCANRHELIWEPKPSGVLRTSSGLYRDCFNSPPPPQ
jgi:hypothetical protein